MFSQVLQIVSSIEMDDGVSNAIRDYAKVLDSYRVNNKIITLYRAEDIGVSEKKYAHSSLINEYVTPDTLVIFHYAMPTILSSVVSNLTCPKVLLYCNMTPPVFFNKYDTGLQAELSYGYRQIIALASHFPYSWGSSAYNCSQLREAGFLRTAVANPPYDFDRLANIVPDNRIEKRPGVKNILFVGRLSPNKRQEDVIKAFYYYHKLNPRSELNLVGRAQFQNYRDDLLKLASDYGLPVKITEKVSMEALVAYYKNADLFLCMSEHEGFCLPIIEAMYFGVPVVAFDSSAIPETVGDAGIVFNHKNFPYVAQLMHLVLENEELQEGMRTIGSKRAKYFSMEYSAARFMTLIESYAAELNL